MVRDSVHDALQREYTNLLIEYDILQDKWNNLVRLINAKGGETFLKRASIMKPQAQLTMTEIRTMLKLCHPDKHNGSEESATITRKLLELRT